MNPRALTQQQHLDRLSQCLYALRGISDLAIGAEDMHLVNVDHFASLIDIIATEMDTQLQALQQYQHPRAA